MSITAIMPNRDGLVAEYNLNRNTTQPPASGGVPYRALDIVGGNRGANTGATLVADHLGNADGAYLIDATNEYVDCGDINLASMYGASGKICFNIGFKYKAEARARYLLSKYTSSGALREFIISFSAANNFSATLYGDGAGANYLQKSILSANFVDGNYYYITVIYDNTETGDDRIRLYLNGVLHVATVLAAGTYNGVINTTSNLYIGNQVGGASYYNERINGVSIYDRAPTGTEAVNFYADWLAGNPPSVTSGLVAHYPLNQANSTSTVIVDTSGNGNHATNSGATLTTDKYGRADEAYSFDGSTTYMTLPNTLAKSGDLTIIMAVKRAVATAPAATAYLINSGNGSTSRSGIGISIGTSNNLSLDWRYGEDGSAIGATVNFTTNFNTTNSTLLAVSIVAGDPATVILYMNGVSVATKTDTAFNASRTVNSIWGLARYWGNSSFFFAGNVEKLEFYNKALTPETILKNYNYWLSH